jgi:fumarate reductase flavoprotein subunit
MTRTEDSPHEATFDVIVVGAGLAGIVAALTAAESGAEVLILEKGADIGGSSVKAGGGLLFAGTDLQAEAGVIDDGEQLREAILKYGQYRNDPATVDAYIRHQLDTFNWMRGHGAEFTLNITGTSEVSRMHSTPRGYLARYLHRQAVALPNVVCRTSAAARRLVTDHHQRVSGVAGGVEGAEVTFAARSVVIASGGFARSPQLLQTFAPAWVETLKMSGTENTGDGLRMAWQLGADVADMGYVEASFGASINHYPDLADDPDDEPILLYPNSQGAIIVNLNGVRFVNEALNYKIISGICAAQPKSIGFQVFDEKVMLRSRPTPSPADWKRGYETGVVVKADSVSGLAEKLLIDTAALQKTIDIYNQYADSGTDADFGRPIHAYGTSGGGRIDLPPFYAFPCRNGLTTTYCGLRVDGRMRVIGVSGSPIPGLFAAGEVVGGFHGAGYLSGTGLGKAGVLGRAAGLECVADTEHRPTIREQS